MIKFAIVLEGTRTKFVSKILKENLFIGAENCFSETRRLQNAHYCDTFEEAEGIAKKKYGEQRKDGWYGTYNWNIAKVEVFEGEQYVIKFTNDYFLRQVVGRSNGMLQERVGRQVAMTNLLQNALLFTRKSFAEEVLDNCDLKLGATIVAVSARLLA